MADKELFFLVLALLLFPSLGRAGQAPVAGLKQPVFLLCPYKEKFSSWSLYLTVNPQNPAQVLELGLEKLKKQNAKDKTYEEVLAAQKNPKTEREPIGTLSAKNFSTGVLKIEKDEALNVSVTPQAGGALNLMLDLRLDLDHRFVIGGKERQKREIVIRYNYNKRAWEAQALNLVNAAGKQAVSAGNPKYISGLAFPIMGGSLGVTTVFAVMSGGETITLYENAEKKE